MSQPGECLHPTDVLDSTGPKLQYWGVLCPLLLYHVYCFLYSGALFTIKGSAAPSSVHVLQVVFQSKREMYLRMLKDGAVSVIYQLSCII